MFRHLKNIYYKICELFNSVCFANNIDFSGKYPESIPEIISSDMVYNESDILKEEEFFPRFDIRRLLVFDTLGFGNFFSLNTSFAFLIVKAAAELFQGIRLKLNVFPQGR